MHLTHTHNCTCSKEGGGGYLRHAKCLLSLGCHLAFLKQFFRNKIIWPFFGLLKILIVLFWPICQHFYKTHNILWYSKVYLINFVKFSLKFWPFFETTYGRIWPFFGTWQPCLVTSSDWSHMLQTQPRRHIAICIWDVDRNLFRDSSESEIQNDEKDLHFAKTETKDSS